MIRLEKRRADVINIVSVYNVLLRGEGDVLQPLETRKKRQLFRDEWSLGEQPHRPGPIAPQIRRSRGNRDASA